MSCIDLFAIATGYLCLTSSCKYSRLLSLWVSAVFWGMAMLVLCDTILGFDVPWKYYVNAAFPILRGQYWFFTAYFMLFFFMPLINKAMLNISRKEFDRLLVAMLLFMGIYSWSGKDLFYLKHGFSFVWLFSMYLVGGYIRLYDPIRMKPAKCFLIASGLAFLPSVRQLLSIFVGFRIPGDSFGLASYVSPFTIGVAVFIFVGCLHLRIENQRFVKLITAVSSTTFGIYLMHAQPFVWAKLWLPSMHKIVTYDIAMYMLYALLIPVIAFVVMSCVEYLRIMLFEKAGVHRILSRADDVLSR